MSNPTPRIDYTHIRHQWPVIATIGKAVTHSFFNSGKKIPTLPTKDIKETLKPRDSKLIDDFVRHVGGDVEAYQGLVPFHMFPQWCLPISFHNSKNLPFDFKKIINLGVKIKINAPLRREEPLLLTASVESIVDNGKKAFLTSRFVTETASAKNALEATLMAMVPSSGQKTTQGKEGLSKRHKISQSRVPLDARLLDKLTLDKNAGLEFAFLTGDFNPLHWIPPYARIMGFKAPILHGYSSMSRTIESLINKEFGGDVNAITAIEIAFSNPVVLPQTVGVYYCDNGDFYLGASKGGKAYLVGNLTAKAH